MYIKGAATPLQPVGRVGSKKQGFGYCPVIPQPQSW